MAAPQWGWDLLTASCSSCATSASQTTHTSHSSCASCARPSSSRPARSCHIPNLTAPSVGICSNLSVRMENSWQCINYFLAQSPGGMRSAHRGRCHLTKHLFHLWYYSKNFYQTMSPDAAVTTALLKTAFQSFFQNKWEGDVAGCALRSSIQVYVRILGKSASPDILTAPPSSHTSPKELITLNTLEVRLSLTDHQVSISASKEKTDSANYSLPLFFSGPSITKTLRWQALARLLKQILAQQCQIVSTLHQRGKNIIKPKPQLYSKYLTY